MRLAIIGSGISGLTCAYKLADQFDVTVYEANDYVGGHTHTHEILIKGKKLAVDSGFIVFNKKTYPHFLELLEELKVDYRPTSMSFSVSCEKSGLEYNGTNFNRLFAQRSNLIRPSFYRLLKGIASFNKKAKKFLKESEGDPTLSEFFRREKISQQVIEHYLVPMMAAVWSSDPHDVWKFPARFALRFFENHGFLEIGDRPQWYVIDGGSNSYIDKIREKKNFKIKLKSPVRFLKRNDRGVEVHTGNEVEKYDYLIIATHSDTAYQLLSDPTENEGQVLGALPYVQSSAYLHTDRSFLPKRELAWAAWNYTIPQENCDGATVTYNMNILQSLKTDEILNVTLNPTKVIPEQKVLKSLKYSHPLFTLKGMEAQKNWDKISGHNRTFYCGAYWRNGFHEDGVYSALRVVDQLRDL